MPDFPFPIIPDMVCTACGCLCDDIAVRVEENRIVAADRACPIGRGWFVRDHASGDDPGATIGGENATVDEAITRAAEILRAARAPLICGLTRTTMEAQSEAVAIADAIGATVDFGGSLAGIRAMQAVGIASATLGEVKNRGDVVVFWGVDPVATHPRHLERYSVDPVGRFLPSGRRDRAVIVVDDRETATSSRSDEFVMIPRDEWGEALQTLRAGGGDDPLGSLAKTLRSARYGAFFFDANLGSAATFEAAFSLVRDLNQTTRFVAIPLGEPGNRSGAEAVLSGQGGSPRAVDFSLGFPRYLPDEATAELRLQSREADAALIVADDVRKNLSAEALAHLASIPTIAIGSDAFGSATVTIRTKTPGIHVGGTFTRCDGVPLPLRAALSANLPSDRDVLAALRTLLTPGSTDDHAHA